MSTRALALYLRLSQEDGEDESVSIGGQRDLLLNYIKSEKTLSQLTVIEYVDDGYSGTNFDRPAVKALLEKTAKGEIACILVKDLSRFGRNYIAVGNYLEQQFPALGVRFVAVNDFYDSQNLDSAKDMNIPFRNLLYDLYSKDISQKVKSSKQAKMRRGDFISAYAPYGYKKSLHNRNSLMVDTPAAQVVRQIFDMIISGLSTSEAARKLNAQKISTPMQYKKQAGYDRRYNSGSTNNVWTKEAVLRILRDVRYTGHCIGGKQKTVSVGSGRVVSVPRAEWVVVPNTHEPIISEDAFETANNKISSSTKVKHQQSASHLLSKKLYCQKCGLLLRYRATAEPYYFCATAQMADNGCPGGRILEQALVTLLISILQKFSVIGIDTNCLALGLRAEAEAEMEQAVCKIKKISAEIKRLETQKLKVYQKFHEGGMDKNGYLQVKQQLNTALSQKMGDKGTFAAQVESACQRLSACADMPRRLLENPIFTSLNRPLIDALVQKVVVGQSQRLEITLNFCDPFYRGI